MDSLHFVSSGTTREPPKRLGAGGRTVPVHLSLKWEGKFSIEQ